MNLDNNVFEDWMNRLSDRINAMDRKLDKLIYSGDKLKGDDLLDNQDLKMLLKISERTLVRFRSSGLLPYKKIRRKIYYLKSDVLAFIKEHFGEIKFLEVDKEINSK